MLYKKKDIYDLRQYVLYKENIGKRIYCLIVILLVISFWPKSLFTYRHFNSLFAFTAGGAFMGLAGGAFSLFFHPKKIRFGVLQWLFLFWGIYILFHAFVIASPEWYFTNYHLASVGWVIGCSLLMKCRIIHFTSLIVICTAGAVVEAICCLGQAMGWIPSVISLFRVSGTLSNPNNTALYILSVLPFCIWQMYKKEHRIWYAIAIVLSVCALFLLQCRTAFVGLTVTAIAYIVLGSMACNRWKKWHVAVRIGMVAMVIIPLVFVFYTGYLMKRDSADGRLCIWKITGKLIAHQPLKGYGYGLFERNYNLQQMEYFTPETTQATEREKIIARSVATAYNDYLEETAQGGLLGGLFLGCIFIVTAYLARKQWNIDGYVLTLSVAAMACVNFILFSFAVWTVFLIYAAYVASQEKPNRYRVNYIVWLLLPLCALLCINTMKMGYAQRVLKNCDVRNNEKIWTAKRVAEELEKYKPWASTSELYYIRLSKYWEACNNTNKAKEYAWEAQKYTSSINVWSWLSVLYNRDDKEKAIECLTKINQMVPSYRRSREILMIYGSVMQDSALTHRTEAEMKWIDKNSPKKNRYEK